MKKYTQTVMGTSGNCWQTCVECLLNLPQGTLPPQSEYDQGVGPSYNNVLQTYLRKHHGLAYVEIHQPDELFPFILVADPGWHMMTGRTVRSDSLGGARHVVVGRYGKMVWDPHPSHAGLLEEIRWAFLIPFPKAWIRDWGNETCKCSVCKVGES